MALALFLTIAFLASSVATVTGFGVALIVTPFSGLVMELRTAIILIAFFHLFSNLSRLVVLREAVDRRHVLVYGLPGIPAALGGAWLLGDLALDTVSRVFAVFLIAFTVYSLLKPRQSLPDRDWVLASGGVASGFVSGVIGVGGVIRSLFLISTKLDKEAYVATSAAIAVMVDITRIPVYLVREPLETDYYYYIVPLIIIAFLGTLAGRRLLLRLSQAWFKRLVVAALLAVAIEMLVAP